MYDSIIIGTGPAGLSAALNLKTYKKDFIWFGSKNLSAVSYTHLTLPTILRV